MDLAAVQILLSQVDRSLEEHTKDFLDLRHLIDYDDGNLCFFPGRTQLEDESTPDGAEADRKRHLLSMWTGYFSADPPSPSVRVRSII